MQKLIIIVLLIYIMLPTMGQIKKFTVEVPQIPKIKISDSIQSFTIMNRSINSEFQNYDESKLQIEFYRKNFHTNTVLLDSTVADTTIKALGEMLYESLRYDIVIPVDRNIYRLSSYTETPDPLDWEYVQLICDTYNTDALLALENIAVRTVTNYQTGHEYDNPFEEKYHYASMDFYSRAHWRIYYPDSQKILVDVAMNADTLYWDNYAYDIKELFKELPSIKKAAQITGINAALQFTNLIAPSWYSAERYYYITKNEQIDLSIKLAAEGNWEGALENWLKFSQKGKRFDQSKIMLNIALAYEMTGDLTSAIEWAEKSRRYYYREVVNNYLKELIKRQQVLNK